MMAATFDISIVISSYNRENKILDTLHSLCKNDLSCFNAVELIIVDDGSPKPVKDILPAASFFPANITVRLLTQANAGIGATRNRGFREATSPVVLFLDDDIILQNKTVIDIYTALRQCDGAVVFGSYPFVAHNSPSLEKFARLLFSYDDITKEPGLKKVHGITSGLLCVDKTKLGFNGDFYKSDLSIPAAEEHEIILRLHKLGVPIYHGTHIVAGHNHFLSLDWLAQQQYKYGLATAEAFIKNPEIVEMPKFAAWKQTLDLSSGKFIKNILATKIARRGLLFYSKWMEKILPTSNHNKVFGLLTSTWFRAGYMDGLKKFC